MVLSVTVNLAIYCYKLFDFFANKDSYAALKLSLLLYLKLTFTLLVFLFIHTFNLFYLMCFLSG